MSDLGTPILLFAPGSTIIDGPASELGGKGAGLVTMCRLGLPVPPGFIIPVGAMFTNAQLNEAMEWLRGRKYTWFSVRSGAPVSMPGMMDTVLNLSTDLQVVGAVSKVHKSAQSERALAYKRANGLPLDMGTAVIVQAMVHGDKNTASGTGVTFTRDPSTGRPGLYGEWLLRATGENLVSGLKKPQSLRTMPDEWRVQLDLLAGRLERHFRDMQDIEWTVEDGTLWLLQTRTGKRTAQAAVRIALDMTDEGLVTPQEALERITPAQVKQLDTRRLPAKLGVPLLARGAPVVPGVVTGPALVRTVLATLSDDEKARCILFAEFTEPQDYPLMQLVAGFITQVGGATSHAAVVARELGKPCIVGIGQDSKGVAGQGVTMCGTSGRIVLGKHRTEPAPEHRLYERLARRARA